MGSPNQLDDRFRTALMAVYDIGKTVVTTCELAWSASSRSSMKAPRTRALAVDLPDG